MLNVVYCDWHAFIKPLILCFLNVLKLKVVPSNPCKSSSIFNVCSHKQMELIQKYGCFNFTFILLDGCVDDADHSLRNLCKKYGLEELSLLISNETSCTIDVDDTLTMSLTEIRERIDQVRRFYLFLLFVKWILTKCGLTRLAHRQSLKLDSYLFVWRQ